jgi:hypothetical protein
VLISGGTLRSASANLDTAVPTYLPQQFISALLLYLYLLPTLPARVQYKAFFWEGGAVVELAGLLSVVTWRGVGVHLRGTSVWQGQLNLQTEAERSTRPNMTSLHK